jgi:hypothetical protein
MAIQKEIWIQDIEKAIFPDSSFVRRSVNHDAYVSNKTVHIPQAGTIAAVEKNRAVLPSTVTQRTDTDRTYDLNEYTTGSMLITDLEGLQVNYNKRQDVLSQHTEELMKRIGDETAVSWAGAGLVTAAGQIVLTTGTATANIAPPSGTGNRNAVKINDISRLASKFDEDNMPMEGRYLLMPALMYHNMLVENAAYFMNSQYMNLGQLPTGVVTKIWGFNIIVRSNVVVYADAATPTIKAVGAAAAATDCFGAIAWHEKAVCNALGETKVFANEDQASYYGSLFSALVMHGSKTLRTDGKGIGTIVQDT